MIKKTTMARMSLAALVAAGAVLAGCSDRDDMTAGEKLDAAVASAEQESRELKAEASEASAEAQAQMADVGEAAKAQMAEASTAVADAAIVAAVNAKLAQDKDLEATKIDVAVNGGAVLLSGTAPSQAAVERAVLLAKGTDGVTSVNSELRISGT
jgi:osmotically-inducible protein OsmY